MTAKCLRPSDLHPSIYTHPGTSVRMNPPTVELILLPREGLFWMTGLTLTTEQCVLAPVFDNPTQR